eukprot:5159915-Amphidinium_carterae.2
MEVQTGRQGLRPLCSRMVFVSDTCRTSSATPGSPGHHTHPAHSAASDSYHATTVEASPLWSPSDFAAEAYNSLPPPRSICNTILKRKPQTSSCVHLAAVLTCVRAEEARNFQASGHNSFTCLKRVSASSRSAGWALSGCQCLAVCR